MKTLRNYQEDAVQSTFDYFGTGVGNPLIIAPVASGKSLLIAETCKRACQYPNQRILVLAHVKELLVQNHAELMEQWPLADASFYCAGLGRKNGKAQIVFGSIQSIYKDGLNLKPFNLVMVDEAHLISPNDDSMYQKLFTDLKIQNPKIKIIGYTGTPYRPDSGMLVESGIFNDVVCNIEMQYLIDEGHLCPPITPKVNTKMSVEGVGTRGGDYIDSQLEKAINHDPITQACIDEMAELGANRNKWLIFTAGIKHCTSVVEALNARGISAKMVTGKTPKTEREQILADHKAGKFKALVNVAVLTTGYNDPEIDLLSFMRPTRSPVLYVQCVGRGMRVHPSKQDVMILDFGGVIDELGPIDQINVVKPKDSDGEGEAPMKMCPKCYELLHAAVAQCECGYVFANDDVNIGSNSAKDRALLKEQIEPDEHEVFWMTLNKHEKKDKPPSMRVTYGTANGRFSEWICFEHGGFAGSKARSWHTDRSQELVPNTVDEALQLKYPEPSKIFVRKNGKYNEITGYEFNKEEDYVEEESQIIW